MPRPLATTRPNHPAPTRPASADLRLALSLGARCALWALLLPTAGCENPRDELVCTTIGCTSELTLTIEHNLDLSEGPHQFEMTTPLQEIRCSVPTTASGQDSCFGFRFADLSWDPTHVTITLLGPFYDTELNPEATPFESVELRVLRQGVLLRSVSVPVSPGEGRQPNGPGCAPTCYDAHGELTL